MFASPIRINGSMFWRNGNSCNVLSLSFSSFFRTVSRSYSYFCIGI